MYLYLTTLDDSNVPSSCECARMSHSCARLCLLCFGKLINLMCYKLFSENHFPTSHPRQPKQLRGHHGLLTCILEGTLHESIKSVYLNTKLEIK
jgi:hypothetical protein